MILVDSRKATRRWSLSYFSLLDAVEGHLTTGTKFTSLTLAARESRKYSTLISSSKEIHNKCDDTLLNIHHFLNTLPIFILAITV
jgi:hypothetical protein